MPDENVRNAIKIAKEYVAYGEADGSYAYKDALQILIAHAEVSLNRNLTTIEMLEGLKIDLAHNCNMGDIDSPYMHIKINALIETIKGTL